MFLQVLNKNRNQSHCRAFVDLLSEERLDVNKEYEEKTILQIVVEAGRLDFAKEVLRVPSCDPNIPNKISKKVALHMAVEKGNLELTKLLLDCGPTSTPRCRTATRPFTSRLRGLLPTGPTVRRGTR